MDEVPLILTEMEKIKGITNSLLVAYKLGLGGRYMDQIDTINKASTYIQNAEIKNIINKLNESAINKLEQINELYYKNTNQNIDDLLQIDKSLLKILDTLGGKNNEI